MTTTVLTVPAVAGRRFSALARPIPLGRLVRVELRKMFDTRSGFWLLASIVIMSILATGALFVFGNDSDLTFDNFGAAIGAPITIILPLIGILAVTSEWTQRSGLTTFTLVPHRGRVLLAKLLAALAVGMAAMVVALVVGSLGTVVFSAIAGVDQVWDGSVPEFARIVLGSVLGMLLGFALGVLIRNSAGAIVAYFVYTLVLPPLLGVLASYQEWFADVQPWVDYQLTASALFEDPALTSEQWQQLAVTSGIWIILPLVVGLVLVRRSEVS